MYKKSVTFRLPGSAIAILEEESIRTGANKTEIIETSLKNLRKKTSDKIKLHPLKKFSGILSTKDANILNKEIKKSRLNKNINL